MNDIVRLSGICRAILNTFYPRALFVLLLAACSLNPGCSRNEDEARVAVQAHLTSSRDPRIFELRAQTAFGGDDLQFKWFADTGECEPQISSEPVSLYRFAAGETADVVAVEVWRQEKRVGRATLKLKEGPSIGPLAAANIGIEVTEVPPAAPGGPNTRAQISGRVTGDLPKGFKVLVYARDAGVWYIQPTANARHAISEDGSWSTWTHTGSSYAVLVVSPNFYALRNLDSLPLVRGEMVARVIVDGVASPQEKR